MKVKTLPILLLFAALGLQCSDDHGGETDEISGNPLPEKKTAIPSFNDPSVVFGYTEFTNARLLVIRVDSMMVDPEYAYIEEWWNTGQRNENDWGYGPIEPTEVFFDFITNSNSVKVTFPKDEGYSLLEASTSPYGLWFPQWELKYDWDESGGITISGKGRGSHLPEATYLYSQQFEAFLASEVIFEFSGEYDLKTESCIGTFSLIEKSPEAAFNLEIYGALSLMFDEIYF
jgi:hypothetical protein